MATIEHGMIKLAFRNSAVVALLGLGLNLGGCGSSAPGIPALDGDWFRCKAVDCSVLDSTGSRFGRDNSWQMLHQLGRSDYSPDLGYCSGRGQDDAGTYAWDGVTLKMTDGLRRDAGGGTVELPDGETMRMVESPGRRVIVFKRTTPTRLTGPCT